ncbi:hypothetical protein [Polaribacter sargassicola]|uniref:hypothetical protein n=1 Tax=Polaribacter sargassicola TaxID=2836891 RepID=UPI001F18563B|nr:hypothetical protein [Polaribacter sp. DS7-9]MCG1034848.1 hypothetical protein [Polaribacter sp. DS7-9]
MKTKKINLFKTLAITLTVFSLAFVSCNKVKNKTSETKEEVAKLIDEHTEEKDAVKTHKYTMKDGRTIIYDINAKGIVGFDDWSNYTEVNAELESFKDKEYITVEKNVINLNDRMENLANTIPEWLKTEEVLEDVEAVQEEYRELVDDNEDTESEVEKNLEALSDKFDELKETLDETVAAYTKKHENIVEEFHEELKNK